MSDPVTTLLCVAVALLSIQALIDVFRKPEKKPNCRYWFCVDHGGVRIEIGADSYEELIKIREASRVKDEA